MDISSFCHTHMIACSWINAETVTLDGGEFRSLAGEFNKLRKVMFLFDLFVWLFDLFVCLFGRLVWSFCWFCICFVYLPLFDIFDMWWNMYLPCRLPLSNGTWWSKWSDRLTRSLNQSNKVTAPLIVNSETWLSYLCLPNSNKRFHLMKTCYAGWPVGFGWLSTTSFFHHIID